METFNIHQAKTHLSRLLEDVQAGGEFVIAKSGKPVARLVPIGATTLPAGKPVPAQHPGRLNFMADLADRSLVPDTFDQLASETIANLFEG